MENPSSQPTVPPKPGRRWFRFSLRTLVLAVTLFCIWLGVTANRANRRRQAVETLRKSKIEVLYDYEADENGYRIPQPSPSPPGPDWLRDVIGVDYFATAVGVFIGPKAEVNDETFRSLADLPHLKNLDLRNVGVTDSRVAQLTNLNELRVLVVTAPSLTDNGWGFLEHLPCVTSLRLAGPNVNDSTLSHIKELASLKGFILIDHEVTDAGLMYLQSLPHLERLYYSRGSDTPAHATGITEAGIKHLRKLPHLAVWRVRRSPRSSNGSGRDDSRSGRRAWQSGQSSIAARSALPESPRVAFYSVRPAGGRWGGR